MKKETLAQVFPCELCEISKNTFFTEHLRATAFCNYTFNKKIRYYNSSFQKGTKLLTAGPNYYYQQLYELWASLDGSNKKLEYREIYFIYYILEQKFCFFNLDMEIFLEDLL